MTIIFYDADKEQIYICTERDKMNIFSVDDPGIIDYVPNDDILYVQNASFVTKDQLRKWLEGDESILNMTEEVVDDSAPPPPSNYINSRFLHPAHNGAIHIADIKTQKFPNGVQLIGKYDFVCVDELGGFEELEESMHYRTHLARGKIEVVDYDYVKKHQGKKRTMSTKEAALDAIIIKNGTSGTAEAIAAAGGIVTDATGAVEFLVEER